MFNRKHYRVGYIIYIGIPSEICMNYSGDKNLLLGLKRDGSIFINVQTTGRIVLEPFIHMYNKHNSTEAEYQLLNHSLS